MRYVYHNPATWQNAELANWLIAQGPNAVASTGQIASHTWVPIGGGFWDQWGTYTKSVIQLKINSKRTSEMGVFRMVM